MTFEQRMHQELKTYGLNDKESHLVMEEAMAEDNSLKGRWREGLDAYPPIMVVVMWQYVKAHALSYCDEHCPNAWFKPVFWSRAIQIAKGIVEPTAEEKAEANRVVETTIAHCVNVKQLKQQLNG